MHLVMLCETVDKPSLESLIRLGNPAIIHWNDWYVPCYSEQSDPLTFAEQTICRIFVASFLLKYFLRKIVQESFLPAVLQTDQNLYMLHVYLPSSILQEKKIFSPHTMIYAGLSKN